MKFQANVPFKLTKLFYEKLGEQPKDKSVLVIRDLFTAMHASIDNSVTFVTDDKEAYELFSKNVVSNDEFGNDDIAIIIDTEINKNAWKDFIKELSNMPKFDIAIMNPPYDGNLHLKILEKVIPVADKVVNISPANQFFAAKRLLKEYPLIQKSKVLKNNIVNIELIAPEIASNTFAAAFAGPLMILTYDVNCKQSLNYMDYNIVPHNLRSVFDKTIRACNDKILPNLYDEIVKNTNKQFILPCPEVHGNQGKADWAEITSSNYARALKAKQRWNWHLSFDTEEERKNCYNAWHTRFHKFIHSLIKADNFNYYGSLPWLSDYTQPWTDKRFCAYFGITGYIDDEHAVPNSEWEIILNTMKEYV
jgi:hypothetical protein